MLTFVLSLSYFLSLCYFALLLRNKSTTYTHSLLYLSFTLFFPLSFLLFLNTSKYRCHICPFYRFDLHKYKGRNKNRNKENKCNYEPKILIRKYSIQISFSLSSFFIPEKQISASEVTTCFVCDRSTTALLSFILLSLFLSYLEDQASASEVTTCFVCDRGTTVTILSG